jgi:hypothetical protein
MKRRRQFIFATFCASATSTAPSRSRWHAGPKAIEDAKSKGAKEAGIGISAAWGSNWTGEVSEADRMKMLEQQYQLWQEAGIPVTKSRYLRSDGLEHAGSSRASVSDDQETLAVDYEF